MEDTKTILGIIIMIGSYFWYNYAFMNQNVLSHIMYNGAILQGETALPLIMGFMGGIIFITGVFEK